MLARLDPIIGHLPLSVAKVVAHRLQDDRDVPAMVLDRILAGDQAEGVAVADG